jgi:purine-binding chemotaxis protein CheW
MRFGLGAAGPSTEPAAEADLETLRFVTFEVDGRAYGVDIASVREIICWSDVTPLPHQPEHMLGVLNLRGAIVPVHDLRARLSGERSERGRDSVVLIVEIGAHVAGILVDAVSDLLRVAPDAIRQQRQRAAAPGAGFIAGLVGAEEGRLVILLDPAALFGAGDAAADR